MQFTEYHTESERTEWLSEYRIVVNVLAFTFMILWPTGSCGPCPASQESMYHISWAQEKFKSKKFKVQFLLSVCGFHTIVKSKNRKLGTFCIFTHV